MPPANPSHQAPDDDAEGLDLGALKNWASFGVRAARTRLKFVLGVCAAVLVLTVIAINVMPKTYRAECRLLAQKNPALALRGDNVADPATRSAEDVVMRHENILNLIKQTNLLANWKAKRSRLGLWKDKLLGFVFPPLSEAKQTEFLAEYLQSKMSVESDDTSVTLAVEWRDPEMTYKLVDAARAAYLEVRHVQEVSSLAESVAILESRAVTVREQLDTALEDLKALRARKQKEEKSALSEKMEAPKEAAPRQPMPKPVASESPDVTQRRQRRITELTAAIEAKERDLAELETSRVRRSSELQAKLQELRAIYTEQHPAITEAKKAIIAAAQESPQAVQLREDLKKMRAEYDSLRQVTGSPPSSALSPRGGGHAISADTKMGEVIRIEQESAEERDPEIEYARSQLRFLLQNYQAVQGDIGKTVVDLKTAEAAFKYRYTVVIPPEIPKDPVSPKPALMILIATLGGLLIGLLGAVGLELRKGVLYAPWQIEQGLSLPVLSNFTLLGLPRKRL